MTPGRRGRGAVLWVGAGLGLAAIGYLSWVSATWLRYGRSKSSAIGEADEWLDHFMPEYDVSERHHVRVAAPSDITLSAATETDLQRSGLIRGIIKTRELVLGADSDARARPRGLLAETLSLGWGVLADVPGREIVMGAVTRPWESNVIFRAVPPEAFAAFRQPGFVKIAWTLRADAVGPTASVLRTETRVSTTDLDARRTFRWYWARFSPGIVLIRHVLLRQAKREAERRVRRDLISAGEI